MPKARMTWGDYIIPRTAHKDAWQKEPLGPNRAARHDVRSELVWAQRQTPPGLVPVRITRRTSPLFAAPGGRRRLRILREESCQGFPAVYRPTSVASRY